MYTSSSNHLVEKSFKNLTLAFLIFLLQLTLSFAQEKENPIQLPPISSDAEKLGVLLQIKEKIPNLFSDAAQYDIDLFALLEDEEKLLNHLKANPKYLELFQTKKYHEIKITRAQEGSESGEVTIDPLAVQEWKEQLKNKLNQLKTQQGIVNESSTPLEALNKEINFKVNSLPPTTTSWDGNALLKELERNKENQKISNDARKQRKANTLTARLFTSLEIYDQLKEPSPNFKEKLRQALEIEQNREDLKSLLELHSVIDRSGQNTDPSHLNWQRVEASLNALGSQDLVSLQGTNYLSTTVDRLISPSHLELKQEMLNRIHKNISSFARRTIRPDKKPTETVTLSQQHPVFGIFRGCTGGDCSSRYSFPYPNDPNEEVFFIFDKDNKVKGYVSATQVKANDQPSLYVITISGNRVTSADAELILRGLEKEKKNLGVQQILLPITDKIENLVNFPEIRSVYHQYADQQPTVAIHYNNSDIRNDIQSYESDSGYNKGHYDHMSHNSQAVVFTFKENPESEKIKTQYHPITPDSLHSSPLDSISMSKVLEFLMDLKRSGRQELEKKVLQIDHVNQSLNREKYAELTHLLSECPAEESITVQQFKTMITNKLSELDSSLSHYLEKNPSLVYPAMLSCTDAFSPANIDQTAKYVTKHLKDSCEKLQEDDLIWSTKIEKHLSELNNTERVGKFKDEILTHLKEGDPSVRETAVFCLGKIKPSDPNIHSAVLQVALEDGDQGVRMYAFSALAKIKPTDTKIHLKILEVAFEDPHSDLRLIASKTLKTINPTDAKFYSILSKVAFKHPNYEVRINALNFLSTLKPNDPKVHLKILQAALEDPNQDVKNNALMALSNIKPTVPEISLKISEALQNSDKNIKLNALTIAATIKSTDHSIHSRILDILQNSDSEIKFTALNALAKIKPTDPNIHLGISDALQDSSKTVRRSALKALIAIKPTDPFINLAILQAALDDSSKDFKKITFEYLKMIKSPSPEVNRRLLQIAIQNPDSETKARAIQILDEVDLSNHLVQESLRAEILKNSKELNNRPDLVPLIHKIMLPAPLRANTDREIFCQSLNAILAHERNLKSLIEFFSNPSDNLGNSRSFPGKTGENADLPPVPPNSTKTHVHPPRAPGW